MKSLMQSFSDEVKFIAKCLKERHILWKFLALLVGVPIILVIAQFIFRYLISFPNFEQITWTLLRLDFTNPTAPAMFFSNYIHDPSYSQHVMGNYWGYVGFLLLNFIVYFALIPMLKRRNVLRFSYPFSAFFYTCIIFLIAVPFSISGISILFGRLVGLTGGFGFSGIIWAFTAYFVFLILLIMSDWILGPLAEVSTVIQDSGRTHKNLNNVVLLIFFNSFLIIVCLFSILMDIENNKINVFGHLAGFTIGLMVSPLILAFTQTQIQRQKIVLAVLCCLIIFIPSIAWIFMG